ncbi:hypothetical protein ABT127_29470 [Streptomyces sp. NPDC001904]|uniref:hypothetical protein n=1 Tax=Streptomyces sp. NPDC001904 TaxID=3154531 RepID=UPI00331B23DD
MTYIAHLHYVCWRCDEDNLIEGDGCDCCDRIDNIPYEWDCWNCGAINATPDLD